MPKGKTQKQHKSGLHSNRIENYCPVRTNRLPPRYVDLVGASDQKARRSPPVVNEENS